MFIKRLTLFLILSILPSFSFSQINDFTADSTYSYIRYLSAEIGPRPMGTVNEKQALNWAVAKFRNFGADSAYLMKMNQITKEHSAFNTESGIAIGIFRGQSDSCIAVGGHIDSATPEIAGANDDASGIATVIELARIWSTLKRRYTMIFLAFGGEESGLVGSTYFVNHYQALDKIAVMLQIDMTASDDDLYILSDSDSMKTPIWLVRDAYRLDRVLGINRLKYPAHFATINNVIGGAGSDHQPFLEKGIPAIDFTAGINNSPIHTQQDRLEFVDKEMLQKCGMLVNGLISEYQSEGIPNKPDRNYELWQIFGLPLFVPPLLIKIFLFLAILLCIIAFLHSRKNRLIIPKKERIRFSGWKLFLMMIGIAVFAQLGEAVIQFFKGVRYPWFIHVNKYLALAAVWTIFGIWNTLLLTHKWKFSDDAYVYTKRGFILLCIPVIVFIFISARLAVYPAFSLLFFSLAILFRQKILKFLFLILTPLLPMKLMFMEAFPFLSHMTTLSGLSINEFWESAIYTGSLTLFLILSYLPFIFIFSYGIVTIQPMKAAFKTFRKVTYGLIAFVVIIGYSGYLFSLPAYNEKWRPVIHVDANYDGRTKESKLKISGNEFLKNVSVVADSIKRTYQGRVLQDILPVPFTADWINLMGSTRKKDGDRDTVNLDWQIVSSRPWINTTVSLKVDSSEISDITTDLSYLHKGSQVSFYWCGNLPDTLSLKAAFTVPSDGRLIWNVTAEYLKMPVDIRVKSESADVRYRTFVTTVDTLDLQQLTK